MIVDCRHILEVSSAAAVASENLQGGQRNGDIRFVAEDVGQFRTVRVR
jgi:hypothetical protein